MRISQIQIRPETCSGNRLIQFSAALVNFPLKQWNLNQHVCNMLIVWNPGIDVTSGGVTLVSAPCWCPTVFTCVPNPPPPTRQVQ